MTERLKEIFNNIPACETFADIGCDHGYIALNMLTAKKCSNVIIADISDKCLAKAESLLSSFIKKGMAKSVVSNGFEKVYGSDVALIAGMGGEEICAILSSAKELPKTLVLQPMKNCDKVRRLALSLGYMFEKDFVFKSANKFYDLMVLVKGKGSLTDEQIEFGKDNLVGNNKDFTEKIHITIDKLEEYSCRPSLSENARLEIEKELEKLKKYV